LTIGETDSVHDSTT